MNKSISHDSLYFVFQSGNVYGAKVRAVSSFEARKMLASSLGKSVTDFYAVREDLMRSADKTRFSSIRYEVAP